MKTLKRIIKILLVLCLVLVLLLTAGLVVVCLVPDLMEKLPLYEQLTVLGYSQQVQDEDVQENHRELWADTNAWLGTVQYQAISVTTSDGYKLAAREFFPDDTSEDNHKWALVLHGYTGSKTEMYPFACWYQREGYHVIVPDLRCQGESEGDFIGMGLTDSSDCMLWIDYMLEQDEEAEIVMHGQSMGAATALIMSGRDDLPENVKAIVSDASYTDAYTMFKDKIKDWFHLPAGPVATIGRGVLRLVAGYDVKKASALEGVKNSSTPTLFIHGDQDAMISVDMAYELYDAATCEKQLLIVEGVGHAQTQDKDYDLYFGTIRDFLANYEE